MLSWTYVCHYSHPQPPLLSKRPRYAVAAHNAEDFLANLFVEDGAPWNEGELAVFLDDADFAAGEFDDAAEAAFDGVAGTGFDKGEAELVGELPCDAGQFAP